ncbi:hypothetical protein KI387_006997, partial [Taxus chinensis]
MPEYGPWYRIVLPHCLSIPRAAYDVSVRPPLVGPPNGGEGRADSDDEDDEGEPDVHHHVR